jgi:hypothetical protein
MPFFPVPLLPPKPEGMSWRDFLIMLLHTVAELEHALMVQYLYAAYSLGGTSAEEHPGLVRGWQDAILTIAREEMGHLITVQNLLLLVGGPVSFERRQYSWTSPYYPFEFKLERLSLKSLACYVYAEMPPELEDARDVEVRKKVLKLLGSDTRPEVGLVYKSILGLIGDRRAIPDSMFDSDSYRYQATWDELGRGYRPANEAPNTEPGQSSPNERKSRVIVAQMATRTEAIAALQDVAGQGEEENLKPKDPNEPSHFDRFARLFRELDAVLEKDPDWSPSRPVADNPYAGPARDAPAKTTVIKAAASRAWASLFNLRYRMLLSLLTYLYRIPRDTVPVGGPYRAQILSRVFGEMYNMKAIAGILVRLPLDDPGVATRAGPPFQLPYTLTAPFSEANFWRMHLDLLDAGDDLVKKLVREPGPGAPADGARYLSALGETDRDARRWVETILVGITVGRRGPS